MLAVFLCYSLLVDNGMFDKSIASAAISCAKRRFSFVSTIEELLSMGRRATVTNVTYASSTFGRRWAMLLCGQGSCLGILAMSPSHVCCPRCW